MKREEFIKYHGVDRLDFQKYIESIGFKQSDVFYRYKGYIINLNYKSYNFYNRSGWALNISLNNLKPLQKEFKQESRSIKLKELL